MSQDHPLDPLDPLDALALLDSLTIEAQSTVDDLWADKAISFQLTVHKVESIGVESYIVTFFHSHLYSVDVYRKNHQPFREAVRVAVLNRMRNSDGPPT
jgi:hypothetical protein